MLQLLDICLHVLGCDLGAGFNLRVGAENETGSQAVIDIVAITPLQVRDGHRPHMACRTSAIQPQAGPTNGLPGQPVRWRPLVERRRADPEPLWHSLIATHQSHSSSWSGSSYFSISLPKVSVAQMVSSPL